VALPAFAAVCRAAARLLLTAGCAAIDRYLLAAGPTAANPQRQRAAAGWDRQTGGRTDARHLHRACSASYAGSANNNEHQNCSETDFCTETW